MIACGSIKLPTKEPIIKNIKTIIIFKLLLPTEKSVPDAHPLDNCIPIPNINEPTKSKVRRTNLKKPYTRQYGGYENLIQNKSNSDISNLRKQQLVINMLKIMIA